MPGGLSVVYKKNANKATTKREKKKREIISIKQQEKKRELKGRKKEEINQYKGNNQQ